MILTCPACAMRYRVAEQEFTDTPGRTVRCANCGHSWYEARPAQPEPTDPSPSGEPVTRHGSVGEEPVFAAAPQPVERLAAPPRLQPAPPPKASRGWAAASRVIAIVVVLMALAAAGVFIRRHIAAGWPSAARLYASTGQSPTPSGTGLSISKIAPSRTVDGLMINGAIANLGSAARDVPRLRVALQDAAGKEVQFETVDPPKPRLQPGEVAHFETPFAHPPDAAAGVVVTFASP
jgi:predicted Zn finger-like uncharacterized protein